MKLQTTIPLKPVITQIDYTSAIVLLGSCFSENMGCKLEYFKFQSLQNPFGILFHPLAIENLIAKAVQKKAFSEEDIFFLNERWHCFDAHSELSDPSSEKLLQKLNQGLQETNQQINRSTHIIITLGTAWVYRKKESNSIVANCHKVPQQEFSKELLNVEEIRKGLENIVNLIGSLNEKAQVIFTISPVRHLKDGFVENQRSKAHLITAIHDFLSFRAQSSNCTYFPSYEIQMDELRDYRFYTSDMVHPNQLAVDYIWEKFKEVWISPEVYPIMNKVEAVQKGLEHRPFNPDSERHQQFLKSLNEKIKYLQDRYFHMKFITT
ncbi:MAG: GSCFA domain-containing protein [Maribacter sp.]